MTGDEKARGVDLVELALLLSNPDLKADGALHNFRVGASEQLRRSRFDRGLAAWTFLCLRGSLVPGRYRRCLFFPPSIRAKEKLNALVSRIGSPEVRSVKKKVAQPSETEAQDRNS
jgi:hypothetical protein